MRHHSSRYATDGTVISVTTKPASTTGTPQLTTFQMRFTSTPRGARLARRLAAVRLDEWGILYGTVPHDDIVLIVAELSANAVRHGRVPGRDFHFGLHFTPLSGTVRVETTDTRGERLPAAPEGADAEEAGRGLLLVSHLAARWGWCPRAEGPARRCGRSTRSGRPTPRQARGLPRGSP